MDHMKQSRNPPNDRLRYQREKHGWSQNRVADELFALCQRGGKQKGRKRGDINAQMVSKWELGQRPGPFWQEKLSELYGVSVEDLGLVKQPWESEPPHTIIPPPTSSNQRVIPTPLVSINMTDMPYGRLTRNQAFDMLCETEDTVPAQKQLGAWLAIGAGDLAQLFDEGWSVEDILGALQFVLRGVKAMHKFSRRQLFQLGAAAVISGVPVPEGRHVSAEDRTQLCSALGENIAAGWKFFHTAGNAQVLAIGQAQLYLVQQCHSLLPSRDRSKFYTSIYNLIGMALQHQGHNEEALEAHTSAHIAALGTGDPWHVTQSLICKANGYQALGEHAEAIETLEEALCTIGQTEEEHLRSRAHLLGCWADNAMLIGDHTTAQRKLEASAVYLDQIGPNEEFDLANWYQLSGKYAFLTGDYTTAIEHFKKALAELPPNWIVRQILTLFPMMATYAHQQNREASFETVDKALFAVHTLNAPSMNKTFIVSVYGLLEAFPNDMQVRKFVADRLQQ